MDPCARGWQMNKSMHECHRHMLENHIACDITFRCGTSRSGTILEAHRYILICRSPVFEAMLTSEFMEKGAIVTVTDVEAHVFNQLLRYMYFDEPALSSDNVLDVLYAAEKYLIGGLIEKCNQFLTEHITEDNVCSIVNLSLLYCENDLLKKCTKYISRHSREVFVSEDFLNLTRDGLAKLLSLDEVGLAKEMDIVRACAKWTGNQRTVEKYRDQSIRDILGDSVKQIRFGSMSPEELTTVVNENQAILSGREHAAFLSYISRKSDKNHKILASVGFNLRPRRDMTVYAVQRFLGHSRASNKWVAGMHSPDTITFQVNVDVNFMGVSVFPGYKNGDRHHIKFCLKQMLSGTEECTVEHTIISDGTPRPVNIMIDKPCRLQQYLIYKIEIHRTMPGPKTYYGINGKPEVTVVGRTFTFTDFCTRNNGTCVREGQIPQILFCKL